MLSDLLALRLWVLLLNFDWLVPKIQCQIFSTNLHSTYITVILGLHINLMSMVLSLKIPDLKLKFIQMKMKQMVQMIPTPLLRIMQMMMTTRRRIELKILKLREQTFWRLLPLLPLEIYVSNHFINWLFPSKCHGKNRTSPFPPIFFFK